MEEAIIQAAIEIMQIDFIQYPDFDPTEEYSLLLALTVILSDAMPDTEQGKIYNFIENELKFII